MSQQLQEVFNSLIENALDAMPDGGTLIVRISPHVELGQPVHRTWVAVELIDTGCGMNAEQLVQIFQPFFTTKTGRDAARDWGWRARWKPYGRTGVKSRWRVSRKKGLEFTVVLPTDGGSR